MSAIDDYIFRMTNHAPGHATITIAARAELSALRARIVELEANIIECDSMTNIDRRPRSIDEAELAIVRMASEGRAALDKLSELESQPVTLAPRKCNRKCFVSGWKAAREAAVKLGDKHTMHYADRTDIDDVVAHSVQNLSDEIRALTPTADCGDCNPLAPDDLRGEYVKHLMTLSDEDRYDEVQKLGDVFCLSCGSRYLPCYCTRDD